MKEPQHNLVLVVFLALVFTAMLAINATRAARSRATSWLSEKKAQAISCGTSFLDAPFDDKRSSSVARSRKGQGGNHNGNGCPHQLNASAALTNNKRSRKTFSCSQNNC